MEHVKFMPVVSVDSFKTSEGDEAGTALLAAITVSVNHSPSRQVVLGLVV